MKRSFCFTALAIVAAMFLSINIFAQGTTSRVTGTVIDSSGAAVSGAIVKLTNAGTNVSLTAQTSGSGTYVFDLIQPGTYTVTVEMQGFKRFVSTNNSAFVNQPATVNVVLEAGGIQETVQVEATAEVVQSSTSGNIGGTVEQRVLESLPIVGLRGRNPLDLLNYQPGFVVGANTGGGNHVHGGRDRAFNFTLDGVDINESSAGGSNFTPLRPNPDSIQEFQFVSANATAELGRNSGAQVTFITRSGTNKFRGSAFEYYQTPDVNANEYQNNLNGQAKPQFVQHIFGGSIGGPIIKDKLFYFANIQMLRAYETRLVTRTVLTSSARAGLFRFVQGNVPGLTPLTPYSNAPLATARPVIDAAGNPIFPACAPGSPVTVVCTNSYNVATNPTSVGLDPTLSAIFNAMPLPNNFSAGDGLNTAGFNFAAPQREKQYDFVTKFDYNLSEKSQFYVRYAQGQQDTVGDSVNGGLRIFPDSPDLVTTFRAPKNLGLNFRWSPTGNLTNEFLFAWSKFRFDFANPSPDDKAFYVFNLVTNPTSNFTYNARGVRTWQFIDNLTYVVSNHTLKGGLNFRLNQQVDDRSSVAGMDITPLINFSTSVNSNFTLFALPPTSSATVAGIQTNDRARLLNMINDLLGRVGNRTQAFVSDPAGGNTFAAPLTRWDFKANYGEYDFYIQDTWRARPNLTLDLGVRYEIKLAPTSDGRPIIAPSAQVNLAVPPSNSISFVEKKLFANDTNNFGPSVGFAWDPFKDSKTSIRANYRIAYDRFPTQTFAANIFQNAPGNTFGANDTVYGSGGGLFRNLSTASTLVPAGTPTSFRTPASFGTSSITLLDSDLKFAEVHSWSLTFQRELFKGIVLETNYIRKRGTNLFGGYDANQVNLKARDSRCAETFLEAFNIMRTSSTATTCLFNLLYTGSPTNAAGSATFRATNSTNILQGAAGAAAASVSARTCQTADVPAICTAVGQQLISRSIANPFFLQNFPQFTGAVNVLDSNDYSNYNGLEIIFRRRIQDGLGFQFSYTLSKSKDTRSFDPTFTLVSRGSVQSASSTPFDIRDRSKNYAWSDFDRRHAWQGAFTYELPVGKGKKFLSEAPAFVDHLLGGWQLSGLMNINSGRPFTVYSGVNTASNVVQSTADCSTCSRDLGVLIQESGTNFWFSAADRALFSVPAPGSNGGTGRNFFTGPRRAELDASILKKFTFNERFAFDLRLDAKNVFNVPHFGLPTAVINSNTFGRIRDGVNSSARRMQISGKLYF